MNPNSFKIEFKAKVWIYPGKGGWHFLTVPLNVSKKIKLFAEQSKGSWGMIPVFAQIGETSWNTSIFPEKDSPKYVLPLKAEIRKREKILLDQNVRVSLTIQL
ncbi:DUF1905 domain-containing protein [Leptospira barantonii]|uniref:DUF1905 domain-containing protein n=1 Tax=Leptospira barantonii TaxID=2023184 RepID=A0A5F2BRY3_9LEPT|nr:DUF1905 domain-containing protein [Leptospira barantonii]TGM08377.1 DUF1905 domain-containing protein [Leptospira barantonii]